MQRYHLPQPFELKGYKEGRTYSDYHPLTREEIVHLLKIAAQVDARTRASIYIRLRQAIPGSTFGPARKKPSMHEQRYPERADTLAYLVTTYAHAWEANPLLVQQVYDLTHPATM